MNNIKYYDHILQNKSNRVISIKDLMDIIKNDAKAKKNTDYILNKYSQYLHNDFADAPKGSKNPYQSDKRDLLSAVTVTTFDNRDLGNRCKPNGLLCLDIDENNKTELDEFRSLVEKGKVPFIHALAWSVSGQKQGSCFGVIKTDMLDNMEEAKELIGCTDIQSNKEIYLLYVEYIEQVLKNDFGINIGKGSKSQKSCRYLAHDPNPYFKDDSKIIEWRKVKRYYETVKEAKAIKKYQKRKKYEAEAVHIAGDWQKLVHVYSEEKRGDDGFRMKAFYWGLKACLLGVSKEETISGFIEQTNTNDSGYLEQIEYVYNNYQDSFGSQSHLLEKELEEVWGLPAGEYLSHFGDKIKEQLNQHKKISLIANTGLGKNYMSNKVLADSFNGVTVMVLSLNGKTEKDAIAYNAPNYFTGAKIQEIREAGRDVNSYFRAMLSERKIFVNANQCPKLLNMLHEIGEEVQLIVDEIQNVGREYRSSTYDELVTCFEHPCVNRVLCMTGTPISGLSLQGFKVIRIKSEKSKIKIDVKKRYLTTIDNIIEELEIINERSINELKDIKLLVRWNSKAEINEAKEYLINEKILKENEIVLVYSGQPQTERDLYIDRLNNADSNGESFASEVKLILATNAIVEGVDVYTQGEIVCIDVKRMSKVDIQNHVQFLDRWRTKKVKKAILLVPNLGNFQGLDSFNPYTQILEIKKDIENQIDTLNELAIKFPDIDKAMAVKAFPLLKEVAELIRWSEYKNEYVINFASLVSYVYSEFDRRSSVMEAVQYIQKYFPYISYNFDLFNADMDNRNDIITEMRDASREEKTKLFLDIMLDNEKRDNVEKALMDSIIDDLQLVKKLLQKTPSETIEVLDAKKEYSHAFNNPKLYAAMKDYFGSRADFRELGFTDEDLHIVAGTDRTIFSKSRVNNFLKGYRLVELIQRSQEDGKRSLIEDQQVKLLAKVINEIEFGKEYTGRELVKVVKDAHGKKRLPFNVTAKTVVEMLNICLVGESTQATRGSMLKTTYSDIETLEGYVQRFGVEIPTPEAENTAIDIDDTKPPF